MTTVWIDSRAAARAAHAWNEYGDALHRRALELEQDLIGLALGEHVAATGLLTAAATELWATAAFTRLAVDAVLDGDASFDPADARAVTRLATIVRDGWSPRHSPASGDLGGTGDREMRSPYGVTGATPVDRARHVLARALADTADGGQIRPDELQVVRLDTGRYIVVLPGVVDLSRPDPGWHSRHRSVRDLDQAAFGSSRSTRVQDNPYAEMAVDALTGVGVPTGAEIMLVGHSYGADTALDLAADAAFNGPSGYRVTHVMAAGYHSGPQLTALPSTTAVLVLQNRRDVPVIVEAVGQAHVTDAAVEQLASLRSLAAADPLQAVRHQAASVGHQLGALRALGGHVSAHADDVTRAAVGVAITDASLVGGGLTELLTLEPGVTSPSPGHVVSVFDGGSAGLGHRQGHYIDHVLATRHPAVLAFLDSVDHAGYAAPGVAIAVDVSVPG